MIVLIFFSMIHLTRLGVWIRIFPRDKMSEFLTDSDIGNPDSIGEISGFFKKEWVIFISVFMMTGPKSNYDHIDHATYPQTTF